MSAAEEATRRPVSGSRRSESYRADVRSGARAGDAAALRDSAAACFFDEPSKCSAPLRNKPYNSDAAVSVASASDCE